MQCALTSVSRGRRWTKTIRGQEPVEYKRRCGALEPCVVERHLHVISDLRLPQTPPPHISSGIGTVRAQLIRRDKDRAAVIQPDPDRRSLKRDGSAGERLTLEASRWINPEDLDVQLRTPHLISRPSFSFQRAQPTMYEGGSARKMRNGYTREEIAEMMAGDADWTAMNRACDPVQEVSLSLASLDTAPAQSAWSGVCSGLEGDTVQEAVWR